MREQLPHDAASAVPPHLAHAVPANADDGTILTDDPVLGAVLGSYPSDRGRALLLAGVIAGAAGLLLNFTLASIDAWWASTLTVLIMAGIGLALGWYVLHIWNREIILYERGFLYREGSTPVVLRYDEIAAIRARAERLSYFGGRVRRSLYRLHLRTIRDERITITQLYRRAAELGTRLIERADAVLVPRARALLAAGERIAFTEPSATRETLYADETGLYAASAAETRSLAWRALGGWAAQGGRLRLYAQDGGTWYSAPLAEIDNLTVLLALIREKKAGL